MTELELESSEAYLVSWSCVYIKSGNNFLLILHWGYSVLGAIIHSAVKESLSAMHTWSVHGVPDQSQNVTAFFFFSTWNIAFWAS